MLILMVSVSGIGVYKSRIDSLVLFSLSDALKCADLGTTKVKEKSCVRGQIFVRLNIVHL